MSTENPIDLPIIEDLPDDIEADDNLQSTPEYQEAIRNAQLGQYEHTLAQMWEEIIEEARLQVSGTVSIPLADGLLRQWPWLRYKDLPQYFQTRHDMLEEALEILRLQFPKDKTKEEFYAENEGDWLLHKQVYIDVTVAWTQLANHWTDRWEQIPLHRGDKGILHASIADTVALLINPSSGLVEQMRNLADFHLTPEETTKLQNRINGVEDE
ncbi:hypothetical protein SEA_MOLEFICENT_48 [Microbacterium phage Moleficent]|uniref:Uncharacterized protein n=2 Tax=Akonivirus TaxID=2842540 RepID=A0A5J6T5C6_9CAUD|nr:hypothetical protein SEA_PHRIEDRICE_49 [Microbacterium phage PhriedRice]WNM74552.1 hypothetical protein SEA_MOLEFICENT_48 [Microbacterium phage Moleficent]